MVHIILVSDDVTVIWIVIFVGNWFQSQSFVTFCSALLKLLHHHVSYQGSARCINLVMKCLWRVIKLMPDWLDELDYDSIFLEVHTFMKDYPISYWKNRQDTPLRTVKTILHSCVKFKGGSVMLHMVKIPDPERSEMESYILRILKVH